MIRKIHLEDNKKLLDLFLTLDSESQFMMYEKNERKTSAEALTAMIEGLLKSESIIFVEETDHILNGYVLLRRGLPNRIYHSAYVVLGVREEAANKGIGTQLLEEAIEWAEETGISRLELTVIVDNDKAIHLYEKMGFELEGRKSNAMYINGKFVDEYHMAKIFNFKYRK